MEPDKLIIDLKELVDKYFGLVAKLGIVLVILAAFFLFTNLTTDFYDTPKFLVLLAVGAISTILSTSPYIALLGNQLRIHTSLVSWITYALFYFVLVNNIKTVREAKWIIYISTIAAVLLSVSTLLFYAGVKILPPSWIYGINFTPSGSAFSTTAILALLLPFVVMQILTASKPLILILNSLLLALFGITIVLTGTWATWIAALAAFGLMLAVSGFFNKIAQGNFKDLKTQMVLTALIIPLALVILTAFLSYMPPIGGVKNPLYTQAQNFPKELQLPFTASWKISVSAFRDSPFWGSSPSTYLFDFTAYKPLEINSSKVWNIRFDSAFNEYLQVLATMGGIGLLALLSLAALFISSTWSHLRGVLQATAQPHLGGELKTALAISGMLFFIILALHASTMVIWIFALILLACFMAINRAANESPAPFNIKGVINRITSIDSSTETIRINALPGVLLTISLFLVITAFFFAGKLTLADVRHRNALNAIAQNQGIVAYNELVVAEKLNPVSDLYRTDLAQVNFALANAIASAKGPTESSPAGSLTDQDKQNIQVLLQQSINEGRIATNLSPKSAVNWEILAVLYRQIAGVAQNALLFSLDSYGRSSQNDPLNPQLRLNVGGVYYAVKNYDLAIRFFA